MLHVRFATPEDAEAVQAIYAPYVHGTSISFEDKAPTCDAMRARIVETLKRLPWLVAVDGDGRVLGYAYASPHRARAAYRWSVDVSVYVDQTMRRRGVARALYKRLLALLCAQGFLRAFAGIALPNPGSQALHEAFGFAPVGIYEAVGFKHGAWHDVGWWALSLGPLPEGEPAEPVALPLLEEGEARGLA